MRIVLLVLLLGLTCACTTRSAVETAALVSWDDVLANPDRFTGRRISMCGWFRAQQDECALSQSRIEMTPIWLEGQIWVVPTTKVCLPFSVYQHPLNVPAKVTGVYRTGGGFGQMGLYPSALDGAHVELNSPECG